MPEWELPRPTGADFVAGSHGQLFCVVVAGHLGHCSLASLPCRREEVPRHECFLCIPLEPVGLKSGEAGLTMAEALVFLVGQRKGFLRVWTDLLLCYA